MAKKDANPTRARRKAGPKASPYDHAPDDADIGLSDEDRCLFDPGHLSPELVAAVCRRVKMGVPVPVAVVAERVNLNNAKTWSSLGRAAEAAGRSPGFGPGESPHLYWLTEIYIAKSIAEADLVENIAEKAKLDWKAAAWILERRSGKRWSEKQIMQLALAKDQGKDIASLSVEDLLMISRGQIPAHLVSALRQEVRALPADAEEAEIVNE